MLLFCMLLLFVFFKKSPKTYNKADNRKYDTYDRINILIYDKYTHEFLRKNERYAHKNQHDSKKYLFHTITLLC